MKKTNQDNPQPKNQNSNSPTLKDLELILNRIEELDAKRESKSIESADSKQAA